MVEVLTPSRKKARRAIESPGHPLPDQATVRFEALSAGDLPAINAFHRARRPLNLQIAGKDLILETRREGPSATGESSRIGLRVGDASGHLTVPRLLLHAWLIEADPLVDPARLLPEVSALLLEAVLASELEWLEQRLGAPVSLLSVEDHGAREADGFVLGIHHEGETTAGMLSLDGQWIVRIAGLLDAFATPMPLPADLPIPVVVRRAAATISVGELQRLAPGDVVIFEDDSAFGEAAWAVIGEHVLIPVTIGSEDIRPIASPRPVRGSKWEWTMNQQDRPQDDHVVDDAGLEDLPVTLSFELGRTTMPLGELRRLGPGSVLPLADVRTETVDVLSSGKRIGRGEIVRVGESLGVRVTRIFDKNA